MANRDKAYHVDVSTPLMSSVPRKDHTSPLPPKDVIDTFGGSCLRNSTSKQSMKTVSLNKSAKKQRQANTGKFCFEPQACNLYDCFGIPLISLRLDDSQPYRYQLTDGMYTQDYRISTFLISYDMLSTTTPQVRCDMDFDCLDPYRSKSSGPKSNHYIHLCFCRTLFFFHFLSEPCQLGGKVK